MGNSCGDLDEYWAAIRAHPGLQGGFVWDWVDQALVQELPDGTERLAYGGDFGDEPNDGPFCINGLVAADRTPHPSLLELAKVVQPVQIEAVDAARGVLSRSRNEHAFVDLSWPACRRGSSSVDGDEVAAGELAPLDLAPGATTDDRRPAARLPALEPGQARPPHARVPRRRRPAVGAGRPRRGVGAVRARRAPTARRRAPGADRPLAARPRRLRADARAVAGADRQRDLRPTIGARRPLGAARPPRRRAPRRIDLVTDARRRRRAAGDPRGRRARRRSTTSRASACGSTSAPGVDRGRVARRGPHECYSDRRAERPVRPLDHPGRRLAGPVRAPAGERQPHRRPLAPVPRRRRRRRCYHRRARRPEVTVSRWTDEEVADAGHLEDLPADADDCCVWIDAAPPRRRLGRCRPRHPRPRTGSAPAPTAGPTASADRPGSGSVVEASRSIVRSVDRRRPPPSWRRALRPQGR